MPRLTDNQVVESELQIQVTTNYDQFVILEDNRDVVEGHVDNLAKEGNVTATQPIIVNERMEIIDGQHRFDGCKENGWPVYFIKREGLTIGTARKMNILQRSWRMEDFEKSYAADGNINYRKFRDLREEYGLAGTIVLIAIYNGNIRGKNELFRLGELEIDDEAATRARLDKLVEMRDAITHVPAQSFYASYIEILKLNGFDHRRMVRKTEQIGSQLLHRFGTASDYSRALEEVYNYAMPENNRMRLY